MELSSSNTKKFQEMITPQKIPYISGNGNPKKASYILGNGTFWSNLGKIFYRSENGNSKKISYIFSNESLSSEGS